MARADARARAIRAVAAAIEEQGGANAASLSVAEQVSVSDICYCSRKCDAKTDF